MARFRALTLVLLSVVVLPATANAASLHSPAPSSPITGAGIGSPFAAPLAVAADESSGNIFVLDGFDAVDILSAEGGTPAGVVSPFKVIGYSFDFDRILPTAA